MTLRSLRMQLLAMGLVATVGPLLVLLFVVFQVEESETFESEGTVAVDVVTESGVSPWVPAATLGLSVAAMIVVWFWAGRAVDPIDRMATLTDEVQAGSLDRRLELHSAPTEIRRLGASFDRMLDRLAASSTLERQLIEDAGHDLRTPLAALAARLEVAAQRSNAHDIADDLELCEAEVERLQATLDGLLASTRSRQREVTQVDNDLAAIVNRVVERQRLLSPAVSITVDTPERVLLGIDGAAVERAVANLVTNAVEHGGGAPVGVAVRPDADRVDVVVVDNGPGIDPDRIPSIFDRYDGDHNGIGLALVKQVAEAYGEVIVESPVDDRPGARFTLRLRRSR